MQSGHFEASDNQLEAVTHEALEDVPDRGDYKPNNADELNQSEQSGHFAALLICLKMSPMRQ